MTLTKEFELNHETSVGTNIFKYGFGRSVAARHNAGTAIRAGWHSLCRNRVFEHLMTLKWGYTGLGWALNPVHGILIRRGRFGETHREGDTYEGGGRDGSDVYTIQETPRTARG